MREEQIVRHIASRKKRKPGPRQFRALEKWGQTTFLDAAVAED
jgi:hypothetical protein